MTNQPESSFFGLMLILTLILLFISFLSVVIARNKIGDNHYYMLKTAEKENQTLAERLLYIEDKFRNYNK